MSPCHRTESLSIDHHQENELNKQCFEDLGFKFEQAIDSLVSNSLSPAISFEERSDCFEIALKLDENDHSHAIQLFFESFKSMFRYIFEKMCLGNKSLFRLIGNIVWPKFCSLYDQREKEWISDKSQNLSRDHFVKMTELSKELETTLSDQSELGLFPSPASKTKIHFFFFRLYPKRRTELVRNLHRNLLQIF